MSTQTSKPDTINSAQIATSAQPLLTEIAYEVCNQLGGIYTVIRSKIPSMKEKWGDRYCCIGPYIHPDVEAIFEHSEDYDNPFGQAVLKMREMGYEVKYGRWITAGKPFTVLFNPYSVYHKLGEIKYLLWEHHGISTPGDDDLINQVVAFGHLVQTYLSVLSEAGIKGDRPLIAHMHEWMAGTAIPGIRRLELPIRTVFTTHATLLGRYLAMNDPEFYAHLPFFDWLTEARNFNIETQIHIERAASHGAHVLTTVSKVTARECEYLIGRKPEVIVPNGLNIQKFSVSHELQNVHQRAKEEIHQFVMGHFFQSYAFDLDNTLYFFTSGRYEYRNKGFDLTLEALARLNWRMKQAGIDTTVVMFFITKRPYQSVNPDVLQSRTQMEKIRQTCEAIQRQVGERLFYAAATNPEMKLPLLNDYVDEYWQVRLRRNLQRWKTHRLPSVITHNLYDDANDDILNFLRSSNLINHHDDRVKIVYHPDFLSITNPIFAMEYGDFVRGCHLGIFPSYYEPWGYTPLECLASGVPAVTSDLSGFGDYVLNSPDFINPEDSGVYIVNRSRASMDLAANQLTDYLFKFVQSSRRFRIQQRYDVESAASHFDWSNLRSFYDQAHEMVLTG
ncbi:MAG: glycosyltransferase [Bacteroidetes bacterium]|nr:MAG: glycosyltransferase [Bacteroidota bacterium]